MYHILEKKKALQAFEKKNADEFVNGRNIFK